MTGRIRKAARFTLSIEGHEAVQELAKRWNTSMSDAVDRAVQEAAPGNWAPGLRYDPALLLDPALIERLNRILEPDVEVVLSSSWRWAFSIEQMRSFLTRRGFAGKLIDFTPSLGLRHTEIAAWLAAHPVDRFVILDDMQSAGETMEENYVYVPDGLEEVHVERAREVLAV